MKTAEEFFRNKIKEQNPNKEIVTLSQELIAAEQGMRWAHEFIKYKESKGEKAIYRVNDTRGYTYYSDDYVKWLEQQLSIHDANGSFISKLKKIIYSDSSDSEIVNALHKLDNER